MEWVFSRVLDGMGFFVKFPSLPFLREKILREGNFRSFVFFVGRQNVTLTALSIVRKSFCLFELIMMIQAFKINKSVLSFLVFCALKFDCFSLLPFVLSLLLLTIEGVFRAKIHNSA